MGLFDVLFGNAGADAAADNARLYQQYGSDAQGYLGTALNRAEPQFQSAIGSFAPLSALGQQFGQGTGMYMDALGINGAGGNARARSAFQASPGYDFQLTQGLGAIDRGAASRGMLTSGNTLMAEQKFGSDLANQEFGNWRTALGGFIQPQLAATAGAATGQAAGYGSLGQLLYGHGQNQANVAGNVTSGTANSNLQGAAIDMGASANALGALGNLARGLGSFFG